MVAALLVVAAVFAVLLVRMPRPHHHRWALETSPGGEYAHDVCHGCGAIADVFPPGHPESLRKLPHDQEQQWVALVGALLSQEAK